MLRKQKKKIQTTSIEANSGYEYYINDPSTPELNKVINLPTQSNLLYTVKGVNDKNKYITPKQQRRAYGCYITIGNSINYFQEQFSKHNPPLQRWIGGKLLQVIPEAGKQFNAYYDRRFLKFFFDRDGVAKKDVYVADSADVVAHELGHAILDSVRPDLWSVQSVEVWGFHEAFSDINAILSIMLHDEVLDQMIKETNGDLMKSNIVSRIAEEMGLAIFNVTKGKDGRSNLFLRDVTQIFEYANPLTIPKHGKDNQLLAECHSFGRVFSGAWYEIMVRIYELLQAPGIDSLKLARDITARNLFRSLNLIPRTINFTAAAAEAMVAVSKNEDKKYTNVMRKVFEKRKILKPLDIRMLSGITWSEIEKDDKDIIYSHKNGMAIRKKKRQKFINMVGALSVDNIINAKIEVPNETYYEFDKNGLLINEINIDEEDVLNSVALCSQIILDEGNLSDEETTMWEISKGKLTRTFIE